MGNTSQTLAKWSRPLNLTVRTVFMYTALTHTPNGARESVGVWLDHACSHFMQIRSANQGEQTPVQTLVHKTQSHLPLQSTGFVYLWVTLYGQNSEFGTETSDHRAISERRFELGTTFWSRLILMTKAPSHDQRLPPFAKSTVNHDSSWGRICTAPKAGLFLMITLKVSI